MAVSPQVTNKSKRSRLSKLFSRKKTSSSNAAPSESPNLDNTSISADATASGPYDEGHITNIIPKPSGFVETVMLAYNQHHALVLRPNDVWLAILAQFNFYVNAHAELLRANFVAHEGKRQLVLEAGMMSDYGTMARKKVDINHKNVVDPTLRAWVLPAFSTTTALPPRLYSPFSQINSSLSTLLYLLQSPSSNRRTNSSMPYHPKRGQTMSKNFSYYRSPPRSSTDQVRLHNYNRRRSGISSKLRRCNARKSSCW